MEIPTKSEPFADDSPATRCYAAVKKMLDTELAIVVFVAAVIGAALLSGCTFDVYPTDQVFTALSEIHPR